MSWISITSIDEFDKIFSKFEFDDAFIKEFHGVSPSFIDGESICNAELPMVFRCIIANPYGKNQVIELLFVDTIDVCLSTNVPVEIRAEFQNGRVKIWLNEFGGEITCVELKCRIIDNVYGGIEMKYSDEAMRNEDGNLIYHI